MAKDSEAWDRKDPDYKKGYDQGKTQKKTEDQLNKGDKGGKK